MKTSASQFALMVDFMERNGDLSKPNDGPHGRAENFKKWKALTQLLNADGTGVTKTAEKWRKVWSDYKNNIKKKAAKIYRAGLQTGGGPACHLKLTDLEERVMTINGVRAATGIIEIPEVGLEEELDAPWMEDSPSILIFNNQLGQTHNEDWNRPGTSAQPPVFPPSVQGETTDSQATVADTPPQEAVYSVDMRDTFLTVASDTPAPSPPPPARPGPPPPPPARPGPPPPPPPGPLPPTPRRRRRAGRIPASPALRRPRTLTQSDLARQAFVRSDSEWRAFQAENERERNRLRALELSIYERLLSLMEDVAAHFMNK